MPTRSFRPLSGAATANHPKRRRHVESEIARVHAFVDALHERRFERLGVLLKESHQSLRDDFEVSTPALDVLAGELTATTGVFGARLTGAGFGGCVIALCETGRGAALLEKYPNAWIVRAADGARLTPVT